jgi:hypothetical protein
MLSNKKGSIAFFNQLLSGYDIERQTFIAHYKDLQQYISPRRGRFFDEDRNKGGKKHQFIINSVATQALRIAAAGMVNGTMNPSRPWFALESFDPDLMESALVRSWLHNVELIIRTILNESNFYNMAPVFLKELLLFGTSFMTHVDDFDDVARFYAHTAGSYYLAQNDRLEIDTVARKFQWPLIQIIEKWGLENVSRTLKEAYDKGNYSSWYPIVHFITPNNEFNPNSKLSRDKAFSSCYFEPNNPNPDTEKFLSKKGFDVFPGYAARWDVTEGDIYGVDCPGMTSLGDVKQLQLEEKRKAQAIDKMVNPPLMGPPGIRNVAVSSLPGGLTAYEGDDAKQKLSPIYQVDPRLQELRLDMDAVEKRINNAFFVDLFLAISNMEGIQPRNQLDLAQRNEERLIQLGPVLERLHGEFLAKMVSRLFDQGIAADIFPEAPPELEGTPVKIRFISTLALAQKAVITSDIERLTSYLGVLVQTGKQDALDKFDADQAIDEYSRAIGIPPKIVLSDELVGEKRQAQAEAAQAQQMMAMAQQGADIANTVSQADTGEGNILGDLVGGAEGQPS